MRALILVCLLLVAGASRAAAPVLADPTRPPGPDAQQTGGDPAGGPVLQSVILSPAVTAAIIDGQFIRLGEKLGSAELVRVTEQEVVLRDGGIARVIKMYPGVVRGGTSPDAGRSAARSNGR